MFKKTIIIVCILCSVFSILILFSLTTNHYLLTTEVFATPPINKDHTTHDPGKCHNLQFNLIMPTSGFVDNLQVLRGIVPVKIEMSSQFQGYGRDDGYGVFISVDYKGVLEEDGIEFGAGNVLNITYLLDTNGLSNGTHLINVNVNDYYDHSGSVLMKVIVDN